jgi:hypothetical protein
MLGRVGNYSPKITTHAPSLFRSITLALCFMAFYGCRRPSNPAAKQVVMAWRPVASWSGNSNYQTDSFDIGTGQWRIKWRTADQSSEKQKLFRVMVHSSVSGRFVTVAVDHPSAGSGIDYVAEDPRAFFLVVESKGLDWKLNVEEGVPAER